MKERVAATGLVPLIIADIYQLAGQLRRHAEEITRPLGQTQARWQVLSAASATPLTVPQIARRLGSARQNVQRVADVLIAEGLLSLGPNPDHKTSPHLLLTEAGRTVLAQLVRDARAYHRALAGAVSAAELGGLRRALQKFCEALDAREKQFDDDDKRRTI